MLPIDQLDDEGFKDQIRKDAPGANFVAKVEIIVTSEEMTEGSPVGKTQVLVPQGIPFGLQLAVAEYLLHLTCQLSQLPYEDAMEKVNQGAMTYKSTTFRIEGDSGE